MAEDENNPFDVETDWELDPAGNVAASDDGDELWGEIDDDEPSAMPFLVQSVPSTEDEKSNNSGAGASPPDEASAAQALESDATASQAPGPTEDVTKQNIPAVTGHPDIQSADNEQNLSVGSPAVVTSVANPASDTCEDAQPPAQPEDILGQEQTPAAHEQDFESPSELSSTQAAQAAVTSSDEASAAAWGWSGGWGLGTFGGTLRAVAAGAVRDVKGLAVSAQQALAEVHDESDDPDQPFESPGASTQRDGSPPELQPLLPAADQPAAPPLQQDADRSAGDSGQSDLEEVDEHIDQLATGAARALSSLWGGLSGMARNTASLVSKVEAATLEMAKDLVSGSGVTQDMAQLQAAAASGVRGLSLNVGRFGTRIEASLETVGRTALGLLEEVAGQHEGVGGADQGKEGARQTTHRTFEELLDLYGGRQLSEDQENLANECARIANRARAKLEESQQAELDATLAMLGPVFSRPLDAPSEDWQPDEASQAALTQLEQRYVPVRFLCQDSATRARAFRELLLAAAYQDAARIALQAKRDAAAAEQLAGGTGPSVPSAQPTSGAAPAQKPAGTPDAPADDQEQAAVKTGEEGAEDKLHGTAEESKHKDGAKEAQGQRAIEGPAEEATTSPLPPPTGTDAPTPSTALNAALLAGAAAPELDGWDDEAQAGDGADDDSGQAAAAGTESLLLAALVQVRAHAFKRLAELLTAQLQLLADHAVNLAAPARSVDVQAGSVISWPPSAPSQAGLLRQQAQLMLADIGTVGSVYCDAVQVTLSALQGNATSPAGAMQADTSPIPQQAEASSEFVAGVDKPMPSGLAADAEAMALCGQVVQQLQAARQSACTGLEESFRSLLFAVLVRELVMQVAGSA